MNKPHILLKTKGGYAEGMGDIVSSVSLAREFVQQGYIVSFVINNNKNVIEVISMNGFEYHIAETESNIERILRAQPVDITILNQLNTPEDEARLFRKTSKFLVTIDDTGASAQLADVRINVLYPIANSINDLEFIPLASQFKEKHLLSKKIKSKIKKVLIMQGGSDTYGFTLKIIRALYNFSPSIELDVVIGRSFSHDDELSDALKHAPRTFNIIRDKYDLSDLMLDADMAISAGGNTCFELACLGVPIVIICGERFEVQTAERLQRLGFGMNLSFGGDVSEIDIYKAVISLADDYNGRVMMSKRGKELVDGAGTERIVKYLINRFSIKIATIT